MCQVHAGAYVSLLTPGETKYSDRHPSKTTTYILHVVSITTHTHDRHTSIGEKETKKRKEDKGKERKEKKKRNKTKKANKEKKKTRKARQDKTRKQGKKKRTKRKRKISYIRVTLCFFRNKNRKKNSCLRRPHHSRNTEVW